MKANLTALLLGGVLPAICFGLSGVFQKTANKEGIGTGPYLMIVGVTVVAVGALVTLVQRDLSVNLTSAVHTALCAALWAGGMMGIAMALGRYHGQLSQLVPLYNMNTLVAVGVSLVVLSEWKTVQPLMIVAASLLTIGGGVLAAFSSR